MGHIIFGVDPVIVSVIKEYNWCMLYIWSWPIFQGQSRENRSNLSFCGGWTSGFSETNTTVIPGFK